MHEAYATSHCRCAVPVKECLVVVASTEFPQQVRLVGALVALQAVASLAFTVALLVRAMSVVRNSGNDFGGAAYFGLLGVGLIAVAVGLLRGKRWAFAPAVVVQVLLLGVAWYAMTGASRFDIGVPVTVISLGALVLLFMPASRAWRLREERDGGQR